MTPRREWSDSENALIRQRRAEGISWHLIAGELGVSKNVVSEHGIRTLELSASNETKTSKRTGADIAFSDEEVCKIRAMTGAGIRQSTIANAIGASMAAIKRHCVVRGLRLSDHEILPAGDSVSWGAITNGTFLQGSPFNAAI